MYLQVRYLKYCLGIILVGFCQINRTNRVYRGDLVAQIVKRLSTMWETWVRSLGWEVPWRRKWQPTPVLLPRKSHGRRSLVSMGLQRVGHDWATSLFTFFSFKTILTETNRILFDQISEHCGPAKLTHKWHLDGPWGTRAVLITWEISNFDFEQAC